jgi:hypothetical protein
MGHTGVGEWLPTLYLYRHRTVGIRSMNAPPPGIESREILVELVRQGCAVSWTLQGMGALAIADWLGNHLDE